MKRKFWGAWVLLLVMALMFAAGEEGGGSSDGGDSGGGRDDNQPVTNFTREDTEDAQAVIDKTVEDILSKTASRSKK
jgi:hypothetical protein